MLPQPSSTLQAFTALSHSDKTTSRPEQNGNSAWTITTPQTAIAPATIQILTSHRFNKFLSVANSFLKKKTTKPFQGNPIALVKNGLACDA
jgi:hypothetical protein